MRVCSAVAGAPALRPTHPLGCHRPHVPDRVVFEHVVAALVHGSGYARIASPGCSDRTLRRRLQEWAAAELSERRHTLAFRAYEQMIGLALDDVAVDGGITRAPSGGQVAGRSPVDRGQQGLKRAVATDGTGIPLHVVSAGANRHDAPLLAHLGRAGQTRPAAGGRDGPPGPGLRRRSPRALLAELGFAGAISRKGVPAPVQAGSRWVVERTHSGMHGYGKLQCCTEKRRTVVDFSLFLAAALVVVRQLIQRVRLRYRWLARPTAPRLK